METFAQEKGFSYSSVVFETAEYLNQALQNDTVDAILTSNLRKLSTERVIAQFALSPFYYIVQKGNAQLLSEINAAMEDINIKNPAYKTTLYDKFYRSNLSMGISFTKEEEAYLKNNLTLRIVGSTVSYPIFYYEDGIAKGIVPDIFALMAQNIGINLEYLQVITYQQSIQMVNNGEADVLAMFRTDFNLAE